MTDARILITGSRSWGNSELLADVLVVAFPNGPATGTRDCMRRAVKAGLTVRTIDA